MWVLKPGLDGKEYERRKSSIEFDRDRILRLARDEHGRELQDLYLEYHEEVPGEKSSEPTYPLRGGTEWKKV